MKTYWNFIQNSYRHIWISIDFLEKLSSNTRDFFKITHNFSRATLMFHSPSIAFIITTSMRFSTLIVQVMFEGMVYCLWTVTRRQSKINSFFLRFRCGSAYSLNAMLVQNGPQSIADLLTFDADEFRWLTIEVIQVRLYVNTTLEIWRSACAKH